MNSNRILNALFIFTFALSLFSTINAQPLTVKEIMNKPSVSGMRVSGQTLSPNGKSVIFLWNAEGKNPRDLYLVSAVGGQSKVLVSPKDMPTARKESKKKADPLGYGVNVNDEFVRIRRNQIGNLRWSPDSTKILFTQNGDIYILRIGETKPKRITKTQSKEFSARFLDNDRVMFQQRGNIFSIDTKNGTLTQISREANTSKRISVFAANPSKNGEMIAYGSSDSSKQRALYVPNYLPYYATARQVRRGWTKQKIYVAKTDGSLDKAIEVKLPKQEGEAYISGTEWLADNKTLIVDRIDKTHKRRQMFAVTFDKDNKSNVFLVHQETDEKWIGRISRRIEANPIKENDFFFTSEKNGGFNHVYSVHLDRSRFTEGKANASIAQSTKGNWEVSWAKWMSDGKRFIYLSTKDNPAIRNFYIGPAKTAEPFIRVSDGMKTNPQLSTAPQVDDVLLYTASSWRTPGELYTLTDCSTCGAKIVPRKLTNTTPEPFLRRKWNEPKFTEFVAQDGKKIPAKMYFPKSFDKSKKYPMVIFVHGAGYLQNVINGWNNYYREFMFNQLLTQKGYVVLDIDYRGSAGYGRDWRTDVYDFLGGKDYTDHIDGIDFMVKNYSVDQKRIGVYGGSYGGFMAAMLVMRAPERIAAAAALRPVMDWKNYYAANPFYTSQRLRSPKDNPQGYKKSSPISYAEKLQKPLLILHGLVDSNVHAQDSIQLVEKLIRLDKTEHFELMLYPAENHGFRRSTSWEDEYERILALFEEHLKR